MKTRNACTLLLALGLTAGLSTTALAQTARVGKVARASDRPDVLIPDANVRPAPLPTSVNGIPMDRIEGSDRATVTAFNHGFVGNFFSTGNAGRRLLDGISFRGGPADPTSPVQTVQVTGIAFAWFHGAAVAQPYPTEDWDIVQTFWNTMNSALVSPASVVDRTTDANADSVPDNMLYRITWQYRGSVVHDGLISYYASPIALPTSFTVTDPDIAIEQQHMIAGGNVDAITGATGYPNDTATWGSQRSTSVEITGNGGSLVTVGQVYGGTGSGNGPASYRDQAETGAASTGVLGAYDRNFTGGTDQRPYQAVGTPQPGVTADDSHYYLIVSADVAVPAPGNDGCGNAVQLTAAVSVAGTTLGATTDTVPDCYPTDRFFPANAPNGVWYSFTGTGKMTTASTCFAGDGMDTIVTIFKDTGGCTLECVTAQDDGIGCVSGAGSIAQWCADAGTNYKINVRDYGNASGNFHITVTEGAACTNTCVVSSAGTTPENEPDCGLPTDTVNPGCVTNTSTGPFIALSCGTTVYGSIGKSGTTKDADWYRLVLGSSTSIAVSVTPEFNAYVQIWNANTDSCATPLDAGYDAPPCVTTTVTVTGLTAPGIEYVQVTASNAPACGAGGGNYLLKTGIGNDCNQNCQDDTVEITIDATKDCFAKAAGQTGSIWLRGNANGTLDSCECVGNWNRDGAVDTNDISDYFSTWFNSLNGTGGIGPVDGDVNCDGGTDTNDVSQFLTVWFGQLAVPTLNCP